MNDVSRGLLGAVCLACLVGGPAAAQAPQASAPAAPSPAHPVHHHRHRTRLSLHPATPSPATPSPAQVAAAGTSPAPVPNEDIGPPRAPLDSRGEVTPGSMSIHYPPNGDGYLPGSSSSDMDNRTTPSVPGVQYQAPLASPAPQPLPPPDAGR